MAFKGEIRVGDASRETTPRGSGVTEINPNTLIEPGVVEQRGQQKPNASEAGAINPNELIEPDAGEQKGPRDGGSQGSREVDPNNLIEPETVEQSDHRASDISGLEPDKQVEQESRKLGGSYKEVKRNALPGSEVHHMPADAVNGLEKYDGPCICMDAADHHKTASYGASREAREYRQRQEKLISEGKFAKAMQMDIKDIRDKYGDKYDKHIEQMLAYAEEKGYI